MLLALTCAVIATAVESSHCRDSVGDVGGSDATVLHAPYCDRVERDWPRLLKWSRTSLVGTSPFLLGGGVPMAKRMHSTLR